MTNDSAGKNQGTIYSILLLISFGHFLNDMIQSVIPSVYPILRDEYDLSFLQIGIITFVVQMTSSIMQPVVGAYTDRHPHPYSLTAGMMFTLVGILLLSVASSFGLILLAVATVGIGSAVFHPESSRIAQSAAGIKKGLGQSIFQVGGNGGTALGPLLAAIIILPFGQKSISWFAIAALIAIAALFYVGRWYKTALHSAKKTVISPAVKKLSQKRIRQALFILCLLTFSKYFYMASMTSYFTFFLIDKFGVDIRQSQLCLFAFLAAVAVGTLIGGAIGDRYGRKPVIWWSIFGAAPFALALPYVNFTMTIILAIVIGLVISSAFSAILVYATELKPGKVGMIAGLFFGLNFGLGGIASVFFGWLADLTSIKFIFQLSTLLPLLGIVTGLLPDIEAQKTVPQQNRPSNKHSQHNT